MGETHLPVIGSEPSCLNCTTNCCFEYFVPIHNYDVWRLTRMLGLAWHQVAYAHEELQLYNYSFRLDSGERRYSLRLFRRPGGACHFLLQLPNKLQRCGVHPARPHACRQYPFRVDRESSDHVNFISHALCPAPQRAGFDQRRASMAGDVVDEAAELHLSVRAMERWDKLAMRAPPHQPRLVREYVEWVLGLYDTLNPLRVGHRSEWHEKVAQAIDNYPLPDEYSSGS